MPGSKVSVAWANGERACPEKSSIAAAHHPRPGVGRSSRACQHDTEGNRRIASSSNTQSASGGVEGHPSSAASADGALLHASPPPLLLPVLLRAP